MRADRIVDDIRQLRTARYERLGDSAQAWRTDIQAQRLALEAQGWVFAAQVEQANLKTAKDKAIRPNRSTLKADRATLRA